jgi:hypothetical protein
MMKRAAAYPAFLRSGEMGRQRVEIEILLNAGCAAKGGISVTGSN